MSSEAYAAVMADTTVTLAQKRVYDLLFREGPMTGAELDSRLGPSAHKRISEMAARNILAEDVIRKCNVSGRRAFAWRVSGMPPEPPTVKPPTSTSTPVDKAGEKPSTEDMLEAVDDIRVLYRYAESQGWRPSEALAKVMTWLKNGAP